MATYQDSRYNIALPSGSGGAIVPIKTLTASSSATLSFVDGSSDVVLDNTYRTYIFKFINCHPSAADAYSVTFNGSIDSGSNYNVTKTTTVFRAYHDEGDTATAVDYRTGSDIAQGTGFQTLGADGYLDDDADSSISGELWLFNPSSTTYVKHFMYRLTCNQRNDAASENFGAGYCNTTSAVDAVQFSVSGGSYGSGTFKLYGIKDS